MCDQETPIASRTARLASASQLMTPVSLRLNQCHDTSSQMSAPESAAAKSTPVVPSERQVAWMKNPQAPRSRSPATASSGFTLGNVPATQWTYEWPVGL